VLILTRRLIRSAPLAGTEARLFGVFTTRVKRYVLSSWQPCTAARPAVDTRGPYRIVENPISGAISVYDRVPAILVAAENRYGRYAFSRHGKHDTAPPRKVASRSTHLGAMMQGRQLASTPGLALEFGQRIVRLERVLLFRGRVPTVQGDRPDAGRAANGTCAPIL